MAHATMMELRAERFKTADALKRVDKLEAQLAEAKSGWDSAIADLREAAKICKEVEDKLAACDWTPISPDNPVRLGDEVLDSGSMCLALVIPENLATDWTGCGFDYRRPLNAPLSAQHGGSK